MRKRKIASLIYLLASHVWHQMHNGFTHQEPGFIVHVVNKNSSIVRVYLPPDAACLLSVWDHCLRSRHYVNVVIACCGDVPTLETLVAISIMRKHPPSLKVCVVDVVDLMRLQPQSGHPHGMGDAAFDALFTTDKLIEHKQYIDKNGEDLPEIRNWMWGGPR